MNNKLILRTETSPYGDTTKGSVLSHSDLDNNQLFLKGEIIYTAETSGSTISLRKYNGSVITFLGGSSTPSTGGTVWTTGSTGLLRQ